MKLIFIFLILICSINFVFATDYDLGSIEGIIQDKNSNPLEEVLVTIEGTEMKSYTDSTGLFYFGELEADSYTLIFYKKGYELQKKKVTVPKGQSRGITLQMIPIPEDNKPVNEPNSLTLNSKSSSVLYIANAGPAVQNSYETGVSYTSPGEPPDTSTMDGSLNVLTSILYGYNPITDAYEKATDYLGTGITQEEIQKFMRYRDRKRNNIMLMDSLSGDIISLIEWPPSVMPFWLDITEKGYLFVADSANNITLINTNSNNSIISTISMGNYIMCDIATGNYGNSLYCALGHPDTPVLGVINGTTNSFITSIPLPRMKDGSIGQPWGVTAQKNGPYVYVTLSSNTAGEVIFINGKSNTIEGTVKVGQNPFGLGVTPDGRKLYVANQNSATITVIDTVARQVIGPPVQVDYSPTRVAITPDGNKVIVTNSGSDTLSIIDTYSNGLISNIPSGKKPIGITVSSDSTVAYVTNGWSDNISIVDLKNNSLIKNTLPFPGGKPVDIVFK